MHANLKAVLANSVEKDGTIILIHKLTNLLGQMKKREQSFKRIEHMAINGLRLLSYYQAVLTMLLKIIGIQRSSVKRKQLKEVLQIYLSQEENGVKRIVFQSMSLKMLDLSTQLKIPLTSANHR